MKVRFGNGSARSYAGSSLILLFVGICFFCCDREYSEEVWKIGKTEVTTSLHEAELQVQIKHHNFGDDALDKCGVCYAEDALNLNNIIETVFDENITDKDGYYYYSVTLKNLKAATTYYWKAFIQKGDIMAYSDSVYSFTTQSTLSIVTTLNAVNITHNSACLRGKIEDEGNPPYTEKGFCFSTAPNPTIDNDKVLVPGKEPYFETTVALTSNTTYYVRAFAKNTVGIAYGEEKELNTLQE